MYMCTIYALYQFYLFDIELFIYFGPVNPCLGIYPEEVLKDVVWNIYLSICMKGFTMVMKNAKQSSKNKEVSDF